MITEFAPAKINLTLEVVRKRDDGYHEIRSVMQAVSLGDTLTFDEAKIDDISANLEGWVAEQSLIKKAVDLFRQTTGKTGGVRITVDKQIPLASGMGGDSSDAAAALRGLNKLWSAGLGDESLKKMAAQLGSDVSFFIHGGTALAEGRGELVTQLPPVKPMTILIITPDLQASLDKKTARLYAALRPENFSDGSLTARMVEQIKAGKPVANGDVSNVFERVAFDVFRYLGAARNQVYAICERVAHLSGSGPTLFLVVEKDDVPDIQAGLKSEGIRSVAVQTV